MGSVLEEAKVYVPKSSKTVADLDKFDVTLPLIDDSWENEDGTRNKFKAVEVVVNGEKIKYRVPFTVLADIKEIAKIKPDLHFVKVTKSGSGRTGTKYTVIPL